jgi:hypothetical protein
MAKFLPVDTKSQTAVRNCSIIRHCVVIIENLIYYVFPVGRRKMLNVFTKTYVLRNRYILPNLNITQCMLLAKHHILPFICS